MGKKKKKQTGVAKHVAVSVSFDGGWSESAIENSDDDVAAGISEYAARPARDGIPSGWGVPAPSAAAVPFSHEGEQSFAAAGRAADSSRALEAGEAEERLAAVRLAQDRDQDRLDRSVSLREQSLGSMASGAAELGAQAGLRMLAALQQRLVALRALHGDEHTEVAIACKALVEAMTELATSQLDAENFGMASQLLKKAQGVCAGHPWLKGPVLNAQAVYQRRQGKNKAALASLSAAQSINKAWKAPPSVRASTWLNKCAVLSEMGRHADALDAAKKGLRWTKKELKTLRARASRDAVEGLQPRQPSVETLVMLSVCLHNAGVQHEHLQQWTDALAAYHSAAQSAAQNLGPRHPIASTLSKAQKGAAAEIFARHGVRLRPAGLKLYALGDVSTLISSHKPGGTHGSSLAYSLSAPTIKISGSGSGRGLSPQVKNKYGSLLRIP